MGSVLGWVGPLSERVSWHVCSTATVTVRDSAGKDYPSVSIL